MSELDEVEKTIRAASAAINAEVARRVDAINQLIDGAIAELESLKIYRRPMRPDNDTPPDSPPEPPVPVDKPPQRKPVDYSPDAVKKRSEAQQRRREREQQEKQMHSPDSATAKPFLSNLLPPIPQPTIVFQDQFDCIMCRSANDFCALHERKVARGELPVKNKPAPEFEQDFSDPWNCQACRDLGRLCNLHQQLTDKGVAPKTKIEFKHGGHRRGDYNG